MALEAKRALVVIAEGSEEMEAVITIDILRRAKIDVVVAGLTGTGVVTCSRGIKLTPDASFDSVKDQVFDVVALPGGIDGARAFQASPAVHAVVARHLAAGKHVAMVCAAPLALGPAMGEALPQLAATLDKSAPMAVTAHPSVQREVTEQLTAAGAPHGVAFEFKTGGPELRVVSALGGRLITSRGPGTTFDFALAIVEALAGTAAMNMVAGPMIFQTQACREEHGGH
ncbi:hypothetical protein H9P43_001907 [Blastocladiella emersonii ATCC 22665]|nr:hypothetical protein H9P43_001907 [Blastocladiella emersonii ATCC 22665]